MKLLTQHWQGKLPLQTSLWFVFIGILLLIYFLEPWFLNRFFSDTPLLLTATFVSLVVTKLIIFPWQLIGLLRASDKDYLENGNVIKSRLIQLLMVLAIGFNLSASVETIQSATFQKKQKQLTEEYQDYKKQQISNYTLSLRNNTTQLVVSGEIEIGITKAVGNILKQNPQISSIALNSIGGHIYEGRGLSQLFTRQSLDTYVYEKCTSSCTTAFSGGIKRYLGREAKLGFHQYKQDLNVRKKSVGFHDAAAEQERDLELLSSRGIDPLFLDKIFNESSDSMWFPSHQELISAKVVDEVIDKAMNTTPNSTE